jgi:tetratricopeptide (TPR) repeat protein
VHARVLDRTDENLRGMRLARKRESTPGRARASSDYGDCVRPGSDDGTRRARPAAPQRRPVPDRAERRLEEAELLVAANRHDAAIAVLEEIWPEVRRDVELSLRHRLAHAWAQMYRGNLDRAADLLAQAEALVASPHFDAGDRAEVLYRRGCIALKRSDVAEASSLFTRALETNERSGRPSAVLAAHALEWR